MKKELIKMLLDPKKRKILIGLAIFGSCIPMILLLFLGTMVAGLLPNFTSASMADVESVYDGSDLVQRLSDKYGIYNYTDDEDGDGVADHNYSVEFADDNNYWQELSRQRAIWVDDYNGFGIKHSFDMPPSRLIIPNFADNDLDLAKFITLEGYQGTVNVQSHFEDYDDSYDETISHDNVLARDYEGEKNVYNRDTRNFYEQASRRIGSSFFLYPGMRQIVGSSILTKITINKVHPEYNCSGGTCTLTNADDILSDWSALGRMYMKNEREYNNYFSQNNDITPIQSAQKFVDALSYGYNVCEAESISIDDEWLKLNICNDYKLIYSDTSDIVKSNDGYPSASIDLLQNTINSHLSQDGYAVIPMVGSNLYYTVSPSNVEGEKNKWFITVDIERTTDDASYEKYLKEVYIPYLYINCEGCNHNKSADSIYLEIKELEDAYKYFNPDKTSGYGNMSLGISANVNYVCSNGSRPHVGTYDGHHGLDINSVPVGTSIYPLFEGTVVEIDDKCRVNYAPERHYNAKGEEYYTCNTANANGCGYGTKVVIEGIAANGKKYRAIYAHLSAVYVTLNQHVDLTTVIAALGNTGCSTGPHLHLELRDVSGGWHLPTDGGYSYNQIANVLCSREINEKEV